MPTLPHLGHSVLASMRSVWIWCRSTVWTIESFCRSAEGKSDGFVLVVTVLQGWSTPVSDLEPSVNCSHRNPRHNQDSTNLCFPRRSSRNGGCSSLCPWTQAGGCRSQCRRSRNQSRPWCRCRFCSVAVTVVSQGCLGENDCRGSVLNRPSTIGFLQRGLSKF